MSVLSKPYFHNTTAAIAHLEKILWPAGAVCPHCGTIGNSTRLQGKSTRPGVWKCKEKECRKQFSVTVGTVFESRHIPLPKMLQAVHLMMCSKKGVSAHQLHRILEITYKSAWFLAHRIREALRSGKLAPMGGAGTVVEADETYFGSVEVPATKRTSGAPFTKGRTGIANKRTVLALVQRGGEVRSFHIDRATQAKVTQIVGENVTRETILSTDESRLYDKAGTLYADHLTVRHSAEEYVRGLAHTNTIEGVFSIFKRGMKGIYQHCGEKHLHRYLAEFDFRYNNRIARGVDDNARTQNALSGIVGKRLYYRQPA